MDLFTLSAGLTLDLTEFERAVDSALHAADQLEEQFSGTFRAMAEAAEAGAGEVARALEALDGARADTWIVNHVVTADRAPSTQHVHVDRLVVEGAPDAAGLLREMERLSRARAQGYGG